MKFFKVTTLEGEDLGIMIADDEAEHPKGYAPEDFNIVPLDREPGELDLVLDGGSVVPDLEAHRARKWEAVKAHRDALEDGAAPTPFGPAQSDDRSKLKISGLVQMAQIAKAAGQAFAEEFTLADNSVVLLDADMAIGMGVAVGSYVSGLHAAARTLRGRIEAAATVEEIAAIDIEAGFAGGSDADPA